MKQSPPSSATSSFAAAPCLLLSIALVAGALLTAARPATPTRRCFDRAGTPVCIEGRMLRFWEQQGSTSVFGLPVTPAADQAAPGGTVTIQYFERARLELHPENAAPYDVLLGRIGAERLQTSQVQAGGVGQASTAGCRAFAPAGLRVCGAFLRYWRSHGLRLDRDPGISQQESLALFGVPLTSARIEAGAGGEPLLTQWFERARLVERRDGTVIVSPLGSEIVAAQAARVVPAAATPTFVPTAVPPTPTAVQTQAPPAQATTAVAPTATPVPPPAPSQPVFIVPPPGVPCDRNVPAPANGLQMWVTDPNDNDGGDQMTLCVRLIVGGEPAHGASVHVDRNYGGETRPAIPQSTGPDGVAGFIFYTGAGSPGIPTNLQAVASFQGVAYAGTLWLR